MWPVVARDAARSDRDLDYRYLCLGAHCRSELKFSWDNLDQARRSFEILKNLVVGWKIETAKLGNSAAVSTGVIAPYRSRFREALHDDINVNVTKALSVMWEWRGTQRYGRPTSSRSFEKWIRCSASASTPSAAMRSPTPYARRSAIERPRASTRGATSSR